VSNEDSVTRAVAKNTRTSGPCDDELVISFRFLDSVLVTFEKTKWEI
jgi:hypothetical protein